MLMECDLRGRVLWMNDHARLVLGNPEYLPQIPQMSFWHIWEAHSSVLMGVLLCDVPAREVNDLGNVERSILNHFFRLLHCQRVLSVHARHSRKRSGHNAVRQVERERQRLSRELHTGVGQMLAAIRLQLDVIEREFPAPPAAVAQALGSISILAAQTLEQVRAVFPNACIPRNGKDLRWNRHSVSCGKSAASPNGSKRNCISTPWPASPNWK